MKDEMTAYLKNIFFRRWMMVIGLSFIIYHFPARAQQHYDYTDETPLVIAADWDFQPFEFLNADGQPSGYNIEVLDLILTQMNIPTEAVGLVMGIDALLGMFRTMANCTVPPPWTNSTL